MSTAINLNDEIELRARIRAEFERLSAQGLAPIAQGDLTALAQLLFEVIETRKQAERQEKELKAELRRHFSGESDVLDCGSLLAVLDRRTRKDLDREGLRKAFGESVIAEFTKTTNYETMSLKRKGG